MSSIRPSSSHLKKHDSPTSASITPQRKHRKLLKDGSGTEVWPESVEKVFVQGLREYWDSPYATYSQSRGRSRWRNQFLVDYLAKHNIDRSKKQVASHIQVLRNMWKGEPEFHLVAGGDELYPESESPIATPVKLEDFPDSNALIPWDDSDFPHSNTTSPNFSPAESQSEFPPTPEHRPNLYPSDFGVIHPKLHLPFDSSYPGQGLHSPSISPNGEYIQQLPQYADASSPFAIQQAKYPAAARPSIPGPAPYQSRRPPTDPASQPVGRHMSATPTHYRQSRNKVTSVYLQADGMTPFSVKVDALSTPSQSMQPPFTLRVRLCVPTVNDVRTPSSFSGFHSLVTLDSVWSATSRCVTKLYQNNTCVGEEIGFLNVTHINVGTVNAALPESSLNRCRWLDPSQSVVLTQEIIVDEETLLFMVYELDRKMGPMPAATLLGYQKYRAADKGTSMPSLSPSPGPNVAFAHAAPYARPQTQPSHSYGLAPMRYPASVPPKF